MAMSKSTPRAVTERLSCPGALGLASTVGNVGIYNMSVSLLYLWTNISSSCRVFVGRREPGGENGAVWLRLPLLRATQDLIHHTL